MKLRSEIKKNSGILVVKLSSLAVTDEDGGIDTTKIKYLVSDISKIRETLKIKVVLVSSGAINAGKKYLTKPFKGQVSYLQACSAVGQPLLMAAFNKAFSKKNINIAQVLLTHEDLKNKKRAHNVKSSLVELIKNNIIPIINENDSVSFDEITVGDNDQLSAMICELIEAKSLLMLTSTDGLYTKDPSESDSIHIPLVTYNQSMSKFETKTKSSAGRGGMKTKLQAIRKLTPLGISVIISSFNFKNPILRSFVSQFGTFFEANPVAGKKKYSWILSRLKIDASIKIDSGAHEALKKNASLLPIGILSTTGLFSRGDSITLVYKGNVVAYGITEYSQKEIEKIKGHKSTELNTILVHVPSRVAIHKDNLVLKKDSK